MCGVSYVSPTYYADRLCERGRLYVRTFFNGDDEDLWADFKAEKKKKDADFEKERMKEFGAHDHKKTKQEQEREKEHADKVAHDMKDWMLKKVEGEFYPFRDHADPKVKWDNPYSRKIADTMFWM